MAAQPLVPGVADGTTWLGVFVGAGVASVTVGVGDRAVGVEVGVGAVPDEQPETAKHIKSNKTGATRALLIFELTTL